jgi:hypothetical protein
MMIEVVLNVLSYMFLAGVTFLGVDKMLLFAPPTLVESIQNYVFFYEYVSWTIMVLASLFLLGVQKTREQVAQKAADNPSFMFFFKSALYFNSMLISVTLLKDYSLGALFLLTLIVTNSLRSLATKK